MDAEDLYTIPLSKNNLIDLLNEDLKLEYAAMIQYVNHSAIMKNAAYLKIAEETRKHADEEFGHAKTIADYINYLGGEPTIEIGAVHIADDNSAMLQLDLEAERTAIARYTIRITQAEELHEFALKQKLLEIIAEEQEHALDFMTALGI